MLFFCNPILLMPVARVSADAYRLVAVHAAMVARDRIMRPLACDMSARDPGLPAATISPVQGSDHRIEASG
jgi:hypothetical protein